MGATATLIDLLGAGALLIWGLRMVKTGMMRAFGAQLRVWIGRGTANRFYSFFVGLTATIALQSSTATALIAASFASRELVSGAMAQAVMLGANVGTSLVACVLSLDLRWLASLFVLVGVMLFKLNHTNIGKNVGRSILGLGLLLLSLRLLGEATEPIRHSTTVDLILQSLTNAPIFGFLIAGLLAIAASSSLAAVLFVMSVAASSNMDPALAMVLVAGANLGGAVPPLVASLGEGDLARRVTLSNFAVRLVGALATFPVASLFAADLAGYASSPATFVVAVHVGFNVALAIGFLPLVGPIAAVARYLVPKAPADADGPKYLDRSDLETTAVALAAAARETLRIGDIAVNMLELSLHALKTNDPKICQEISRLDDVVDRLHEAVKIYLTQLTQSEIEPDEAQRATEIISYAINLEHIGDIVEKGLADLAARKIKHRLSFSEEGFAEIERFFAITLENMRIAQTIFLSGDADLARRLIEVKVEVRHLEQASAESHLQRIRRGLTQSLETSTLHLDVLRDLKRINAHITSVAYPVLDGTGQLRESRLRSQKTILAS